MTIRSYFTAGTACIATAVSGFIFGVLVSPASSDQYVVNGPLGKPREVLIAVETYRSTEELQWAAEERGMDPTDLQAFAHYREPTKLCTIHIVDPAISLESDLLGHEMLHCFYGDWHQ